MLQKHDWLPTTALLALLFLPGAPIGRAAAQGMGQSESALAWRILELPPVSPIPPEAYASRRQAFAAALGDGGVLVFGARSPAHDYLPYQQNPAFRYLTGIEEPDAALILVRSDGQLTERLFVQARNPSREAWEGARLGPEGARVLTRVPAEVTDRLPAVLDSLLREHPTLYTLSQPPGEVAITEELGFGEQVLARIVAARPDVAVKPAAGALSTLRAKKSAGELERIRRATYLSAEAHRQAMQATEPGMNEFEIRALVEYFFLRNGGGGPAYASIVGSGPNSTTLHYNADNRCMNDGEVLLFDVGTYYDGYAADVTRTIPVNGKFTPEQRAIYEVVLAAQKAAEAQIRQGASWQELNGAASAELANGLARIGLIDAPDATYDCGTGSSPGKCQQIRMFYMHGLGHGVGLDVHDPDVFHERRVPAGQRCHDRTRHLRALGRIRLPTRHAGQPRDGSAPALNAGALRKHRCAHRGCVHLR
jgi:Xaa-Pro aminopeptidase